MSDVLTWEEIQRRYPDEWVLIDDPLLTEDLEVVEGRVVSHSKDADEVHRTAMELRLQSSALFFMGEPDPDLIFVF